MKNLPMERQCGNCNGCCIVFKIDDYPDGHVKESGEYCRHMRNVSDLTFKEKKHEGCCEVHGTDEQPKSCRDFHCMWRKSLIPEECKPMDMGCVVTAAKYGTVTVVTIREFLHGGLTSDLSKKFIDGIKHKMRDGAQIVLVKQPKDVYGVQMRSTFMGTTEGTQAFMEEYTKRHGEPV